MPKQIKKTKQKKIELSYVDGNTVRKLAESPARVPRPVEEPEKRHRRNAVRRNRERQMGMSGPYVLFLAAAAFVCLFICIQFLMVQADNQKISGDITKLEKELDQISARNDALDYSINSFIDVDYIIKAATEELGMVKMTKDNVESYESTRSEYINQYKDIPK